MLECLPPSPLSLLPCLLSFSPPDQRKATLMSWSIQIKLEPSAWILSVEHEDSSVCSVEKLCGYVFVWMRVCVCVCVWGWSRGHILPVCLATNCAAYLPEISEKLSWMKGAVSVCACWRLDAGLPDTSATLFIPQTEHTKSCSPSMTHTHLLATQVFRYFFWVEKVA